MTSEWRFSDWDVHVVYAAIDENQENSWLKIYAGAGNIPAWLETLRSGTPIVVNASECDKEFFPELVEQEFLRLARLDENIRLRCGCEVLTHRKVLQQFRLKNLSP